MNDVSLLMVSTKRKIVRNTVANTLLKLSQYIIGFLMFPFIISYVGVEDYGIYLLVGAFTGYFGLLDFGVGSALVKYVAQYRAKEDKKTLNEMVNSTFVFYLSVGIVICISLCMFGIFFIEHFNIDESQIEKAQFITFFTAVGALTAWPMKSFSTILGGLQRYDILAVISFLTAIINAFITILLLINGYGIIDMIFWGIIIGVFGQLATVLIVCRLVPYLAIKREYLTTSTMKRIFTFSSVVFVGQIAGILMLGLDRVIIGFYISVGAITSYAVARKLHDLIATASELPQSAILPAATELDTLNKKDALERLLIRGSKYKCALMLSVGMILFVLAEPIIQLWMGDDFLDMVLPTRVFIFYTFFSAYGGVSAGILFAQEKFKPILLMQSLTAISNLILSLVLVQYYGVLGVVLGTAIPWIVISPFLTPYVLKLMNMDVRKYILGVIPQTYIPAVIVGCSLYAITLFYYPSNLYILGLICLFGLCLYFTLFYQFGMNSHEKGEIKKVMHLKPPQKARGI